ncbi:hypothetical protein [uncultured Thiodictyon sp.]|uniref:hypothetical protein n=1 Tax=uncultured Thiodictyon sp. TaxID=1846217 RepID=UPI0025FE8460|nr:hypothetical protein [uncultured Thiodictyon sp.]
MRPQTQEIERAMDQLGRREKLHLIEVLARSLQRGDDLSEPPDRRANLDRLRAELAGLPIGNPGDGRSNRDHDAVIYGAGR